MDGVHPELGVPDPEVADQGVDVDHVVLAQLGARFRSEKVKRRDKWLWIRKFLERRGRKF